MEHLARTYISQLDSGNALASVSFIDGTLMATKQRPRGLKGLISSYYSNSHHLWMWDHKSLAEELKNAGFTQIRECKYNDSEDDMFKLVEDESRFKNAVAIECRK